MAVARCNCADVVKIVRSEKVIDCHCYRCGLSWSYRECLP